MTNETVSWKGASGNSYPYGVYGFDTRWNDKAGNYIFASRANGTWKATYVGQTESFLDRLPNHNEIDCARRNGATHVHAHTNNGGEEVRKAEEADLIKAHQPPCNSIYK